MIEMSHPLGRIGFTESRTDFIVRHAQGKSVLHVGCVDAGLLEERLQRGDLLHARLAAVARRLTGVDIDQAGLARLRELGFENLLEGDVQGDLRLPERFDLIVAGEIIEHLSAPGHFLARIAALLTPGGELLLSVPNAYSLLHALKMARGIEVVHPDHVSYFSPTTLRTLLSRYGLEVVEASGYSEVARLNGVKALAKRMLNRVLFKHRPQLAEGLVVVARIAKGINEATASEAPTALPRSTE